MQHQVNQALVKSTSKPRRKQRRKQRKHEETKRRICKIKRGRVETDKSSIVDLMIIMKFLSHFLGGKKYHIEHTVVWRFGVFFSFTTISRRCMWIYRGISSLVPDIIASLHLLVYLEELFNCRNVLS